VRSNPTGCDDDKRGGVTMDILLYAALEQRTQNQQLEELLREMVIRIKENTKEIKRLSRKQGGLK